MTGLKITTGKPQLLLPEDAVTQTFGILAVRGAGKTNTAVVMAEEMWKAELPFVVVDPVGVWYGLRSAFDGKSPSDLEIPVFGGRRGDVPLEKGGGQLIADLVVDERLSCVLDCSELSEGDKIHFLIDFAERLYRRNEEPLHLFLEEADDYAPQRPLRDQARLLGAWQRVVRRGRSRGLGITMVTQRSAALNKDVLTQIETLIVLRTTSPQDRKAIEGWVEYHGQSRELLESLSGLENGEAWVWSPHWLGKLERIHVRRRETFDSASTPSTKKGRKVATLADVDLGALQERMTETIERAKAEDPKELHKRIRQLEAELRKRPTEAKAEPVEVPVEVPVEIPVFKNGELGRLEKAVDKMSDLGSTLTAAAQEIGSGIRSARELAAGAKEARAKVPSRAVRGRPATPAVRSAAGSPTQKAARGPDHRSSHRPPTAIPEGDAQLAGGHRKILNALAWWEAIGFPQANRVQVGFIAGYNPGRRGGGHFGNLLGNLRTWGLVDYPRPALITLTDEGRALAEVPAIPQSVEGFQEAVFSKLTGGHRRILEVLVQTYPDALPKSELAERAGYSAGEKAGGHFGNLLGNLRTFGLIHYPSPGYAAAEPVLFLEAVPA
jgi:hypothetical protein